MSGGGDFSGCFRVVTVFAVIFIIFAWIFVQSETLELRHETVSRNGMSYQKTRYVLHWDRFTAYVRSIPGHLMELFTSAPDLVAPEPR